MTRRKYWYTVNAAMSVDWLFGNRCDSILHRVARKGAKVDDDLTGLVGHWPDAQEFNGTAGERQV